jgi:GTPase SAR1 family protein
MQAVDENAPENILRILVANKCDLKNRLVISSEAGQMLADRYHIAFFETSAKSETSSSITNMFRHIAEKLSERKQHVTKMDSSAAFKLSDESYMKTVHACCSLGQIFDK